MTSTDTGADQDWAALTTLNPDEREARMHDRYMALAGLSEEERRAALRSMAQAEYALSDDLLRPFTLSRLRVWLQLEPAVARQIAGSYDAVMTAMPAQVAMRRVGIVQTLAVEFPPEDEERLRSLAPAVFAGQPRRIVADVPAQPAPEPAAPAAKRPWWAFWKK